MKQILLTVTVFLALSLITHESVFCANRAYFGNEGAGLDVYAIDTSSQELVDQISPVGTTLRDIAITPDGKLAYVVGQDDERVSIIDTSSNEVIAIITVGIGSSPQGLAINPNGKFAYVTNQDDDSVSVIDIGADPNIVITVITLQNGTFPTAVAVTPNGKFAYIANGGDNSVSIIDTDSNTVITNISVGGDEPRDLAITPDGKFAYVANSDSGNVSVIDTGAQALITTIPVISQLRGIAITPDGKFAYVTAAGGNNNVHVISTDSKTVIGTAIPLDSSPQRIAITPDGKFAYVAGGFIAIDTATKAAQKIVITINISTFGVAITPVTTLSVTGRAGKDIFLTETNLFNSFSWSSPTNAVTVARYNIYREGALIGTVSASSPREFRDNNLSSGQSYLYVVQAENDAGTVLARISHKALEKFGASVFRDSKELFWKWLQPFPARSP